MQPQLLLSPRLAILVLLIVFGCGAGPAVTELADPPDATRQGPNKWALLIGINEYQSTEIVDLTGAANDVERMRRLLVGKFEFPEENVRVLLNEEATHDGIIAAVRTHLIDNAQPGDIVVMHYSGHGSQMKDQEGPGGDESDGMDETIVPHDSRIGDVYDVSDDELNGLLAALTQKTQNVTFIFDSCHSGTATRAIGTGGLERRIEPDLRDPPSPSEAATRGSTLSTRSANVESAEALRAPAAGYVLISGARADQLAREYRSTEGEVFGAMTYFLTEELWRAGGGVTYRDVMDKIKAKVNSFYQTQEPQLEGTALDNYVFSDSSSLAQPYVAAEPASDGSVRLHAGAVHGMTVGSEFNVYPPGTKQFEQADSTARVRLTTVDGLTSTAEIVAGGPVEAASRAVERLHAFGDRQLLVHYENLDASPALQAVKQELDPLSHIRPVDAGGGFHLLLREEDGAVQIAGASGTEIGSAPVPTSRPQFAAEVADMVRTWTTWFNVLSIENPSPGVRVELKIRMQEAVGGTRDPFRQPDEVSGEFRENQEFQVVVYNRSDRPLFISVLDLAGDGEIFQMYPYPEGASERLGPGDSLETIPFAFTVPEGVDATRDVIKVFATPGPINVGVLTQTGTRSTEAARALQDPLGRLLAQATQGTRGIRPAVQLGNWVTDQRAVRIRRAP